jgi:HlyD family secretion protein
VSTPAGRHRRRQDRHRLLRRRGEHRRGQPHHAKADLEQKKFDWDRAQALYTAQHHGQAGLRRQEGRLRRRCGFATPSRRRRLAQAKAQTDSARGHLDQVATLRANSDALDKTIAIAPFDGIVTNEPVREGETVVVGIQNAEGSTLMTLADMSIVTAEVKVDETDIVNLQLGQPAEVTVDALPGRVFKGHVTLVGDQALLRSTGIATSQSTTGTEEAKDFKVVVTLDNPSDELRPGLSCTAKVTTAHKSNVLTLPIQALTMHDPASDTAKSKGGVAGRNRFLPAPKSNPVQGVFVADKDPKGKLRAKFVPVTTGITGATDIEVLSGLNQGQEVVTGPYKTLRDLKGGSLLKRDTVKVVLPSGSSS